MDPLIEQYETWAYPRPIEDLDAYAAAGGHDYSDPARLRRKIWPRAVEPAQLNILVAGCGANQAAILAHANPKAQVIGIDLSRAAVGHHERLKARHHLDNLQVKHLAVEDAATLGRRFDLVVSTGVLHHLASPVAGLRALREVLAPHGAISVMLYGRHRRAGVYMVQEALRALGAARTPAGVAFARDVVDRLPDWHPARQYIASAPDLGYEAGFVDTFLNARDRAYSVPEIMALADDAGLRFQSWLDGLHYSPAALFAGDAAIQDHIHDLALPEQWHIADLLGQVAGAHRFLLCHQDATPPAFGPRCVPIRHPDLRVTETTPDRAAIAREWHTFQLNGDALAAFRLIDGTRTLDAIMQRFPAGDRQEFVGAVLSQLAEWDHIHFAHPLTD